MAKSKGKRKIVSGPTSQADGKRQCMTTGVSRKPYNEDNLLCELVTKCGLILMDGEELNELNVTKSVFQTQLGTAIKTHVGDFMQTIDEFLRDFKHYISETTRFHKCLHPCIFSDSCESVQASAPESTIRLLLGVDVIQSQLMTLLLDKLKETGENAKDYNVLYQGQRIYIPRLLLSQLRFLDKVVDGKGLCKALLGVLSVPVSELQKEVLACIPDVVEDSEHQEVAGRLRQELLRNRDLICPVIDALTYLNVSKETVNEVRESVLEMLKSESFCLSNLPVIVKFLLESISNKDALEVIDQMRLSICLTLKDSLTESDREKARTGIKLAVDVIKGCMQFHHYVAEAWMKAIDVSNRVYYLDIFVLLILESINQRKAVESLIKSKIRSGCLTVESLDQLFETQSLVLREYLLAILKLAQSLLHSVDTPIWLVAIRIYKLAFQSFDAFSKQEVVGNLITHTGSGYTVEVDAALQLFSDLLEYDLKAMARFAVFLKGVLDYFDHTNLSISQIGILYQLLARLAFHTKDDASFLQNELHIIVRKQLTSGSSRFKRMGVVGAVALVSALANEVSMTVKGKARSESETSSSTQLKRVEVDKERQKEVVSLMNLVETSISQEPEMCSLFLDSLSRVVKGFHPIIKEWLCERMTSVLEEKFVSDTESVESNDIPMEPLFNLNDEEESSIVINLLPVVKMMSDRNLNQDLGTQSLLCLAPLFRLVTVCQWESSDGSLEDIDALLGCPVFMPKWTMLCNVEARSQREKDIVCNSLFFCINWFREIVNSFADIESTEMKGKVLQRLRNITELMTILKKWLNVNPSFNPPLCVFDSEIRSVAATSAKTPKPNPKTNKKGGKKKQSAPLTESSQLQDNSQPLLSGVSQEGKGEEESSSPIIDFTDFRHCFRELDLAVFNILNSENIAYKYYDTNLNTKTMEDLKLELPHLQFLLDDLSSKLSYLLTISSSRQTFFKTQWTKHDGFSNFKLLSSNQIAKKCVRLLPNVCDHLEGICGFFQMQMNDNDGLMDGPNRYNEESCIAANCYQLLLQCILSLFSWNGFSSGANKGLFREGLHVFMGRIRSSSESATQVSQQDSLQYVFKYFSNFADTIPKIEAGVFLIKLLMVMIDSTGDIAHLKENLAKISGNLLSREWKGEKGEKLKGVKFNEQIQVLVKCLITCHPEPLEALESLVAKGMLSMAKDNKCEDYPSLTRVTFPIFFKIILQELVNYTKKIPAGKKNDADELNEDKLLTWSLAVKVLHLSISLIKVVHTRSCLSTVLKCGRQFLEAFLKTGMPLLDRMFRRHHATVERLLKTLQQSTRTMHHLCGHSKIVKDVSMTNQVPMLKRALEAFVYRVKAMLTVNNCQDAFWMGNLKNKNLQGEEILSQSQSQEEENEEEEDDDNDEDSDNDNDNKQGSYSQVY